MDLERLPTYADVKGAAARILGHATRTPLISNSVLDDLVGGTVLLKPECLQRTGSFKFRGACNAIAQAPDSARQTGILAVSSGNHAQGIAEVARLMGFPATILMPSDAPQSKKDRTRRSGATVIEYDRHSEDREALGDKIREETGAYYIHPFNHPHVVAGQGTCGLEICEDLKERGLVPDQVLVCAGGGGFLAGVLLSMNEHFPQASVHPVEPYGYDDQRRSHEAGVITGGNTKTASVCDAIVTPEPGAISFSICKGKIGKGLVVTDEEALQAVAFAYHELKLVVEPGGAVCLAALLSGKLDAKGKTIVATLSGGNIDPDMMARALAL